MKLGIRKIEYIDTSRLYDYSTLAPGSTLDVRNFIQSGYHFTELPFTPETGDLEEHWQDDDGGQFSKISFNAAIRRNKSSYKSTLQQLVGRKCVWKLTLISGLEYLLGSKEFVPKFTYGEGVSGLSSSEFNISIDVESIHGLLINQEAS
jgi:hypothetical protein